jgi:hypothetical protein
MENSLRTLLIRVATLTLFVGMIGGLVLYRCKTAKPKKDLSIALPEDTSWLFSILNQLDNERLPSSKAAPIFIPSREDTLTAYEVFKMRRALKTAPESQVMRYNAHYQRARLFPSETGFRAREGDSRHAEEHHLLSDSATAWLFYRYQPEQLSIGQDKVSQYFQQLLKERQKANRKYRAPTIGRSDTVIVLRQMIAEQWFQ